MSALPSFRLAQPPGRPRLALSDPPPDEQFTTKYRPARLEEIVGQPELVSTLRAWMHSPRSTAMLFSGPTGLGKTSAAFALAGELGIDPESVNFLHHESGQLDGAATEETFKALRYAPWPGEGAWRIVLCDEADQATFKARQLWLSQLDHLPPRTLVIWTTNHVDKLAQREVDRFPIKHAFIAQGQDVLDGAQELANRIWHDEVNPDQDGPDVLRIVNVLDVNGAISQRRVASAMEGLIKLGQGLLTAPIVPQAHPAAHEARPLTRPAVAPPVAPRSSHATAEAWWTSLTPPERVRVLESAPRSPFPKVQAKVERIVSHGFPPPYGRFVSLDPIIDAAFLTTQRS